MGTLSVNGRKKKTNKLVTTIVMLGIGILMCMPFVFMLSASFKPTAMVTAEPLKLIPDKLFLGNYEKVFGSEYYFTWYLNTIKVVVITIILKLLFVTMAAYAFARLKFPGKKVLFLILFSVWMIPSDATIVSRFLVYKELGLTDTHWAIILPSVFDVFMLFMAKQFFAQIPFELTEAAILDGCSHFKIYYKIILPLVKPMIMTMILFTFIWTWNSFIDPFIFITQESKQLLTVGLQYFQSRGGSDLATQLAGASLGVIPPVIFFIFAQKYFVQGISASGIKG